MKHNENILRILVDHVTKLLEARLPTPGPAGRAAILGMYIKKVKIQSIIICNMMEFRSSSKSSLLQKVFFHLFLSKTVHVT